MSTQETEQESEESKIIIGHVHQLMEHFDAVRIFGIKKDCSADIGVTKGAGSIYAQYGFIQEWKIQMDEESRKHRVG